MAVAAEHSGTLLGRGVLWLQPPGCWPGGGHVLPAGGSNIPPGENGLGTHFPRPCVGSNSCAPSWREGVGGVSGSSCGECLPRRRMSQVGLGLCSASLPAALVSCGLGRGWEHRGMGEGVSNLPAAARGSALPAFLESICPDHFLVCAHTEAEQV